MSDGELIVHVTRSLLINAELLMTHARRLAPTLMEKDARGLAALYMAANNMVEGAHDLMAQSRNLAERAMKEKCGLLVAPAAADEHAKPQPLRPRPFVGLIEKFGGVKAPAQDGGMENESGVAENVPPTRSVN